MTMLEPSMSTWMPFSTLYCLFTMPDRSALDIYRYFVVNGRRWRKTDPSIPAVLSKQLVRELMSARSAVKTAKSTDDFRALALARARVSDAKISLGERGRPWWETPTEESLNTKLVATIRCLLRSRAEQKTICPSEAARVVGGDHWRDILPKTVEVAWILERKGWLHVMQNGERVSQPTTGAIRLKMNKDAR